MHRSSNVWLVSFADGPFAPRRVNFIKQARELEVFDHVMVFDQSRLPSTFVQQHGLFMSTQARGFGYWIWKPQVIELALRRGAPGDVVVYLDVGFTLNSAGRARFIDYLDIALDSPTKMLSFQNTHTEYRWTKADLARRLGVLSSASIMNTTQLTSGFIIFGATPENLDLVREWKQIAVEDGYRYSDDSASEIENHPLFQEHRHDQSISSLLRKVRGTEITHYEVQAYDRAFEGLRRSLPALATRSRV